MNRTVALAATGSVTISRFDHPPGAAHRDPREEEARHHAVCIVERGAFEVRIGRRTWRLSEGMAFVTRPGLVYRSHHDGDAPTDVCLSIAFSDAFRASADGPLRRRASSVPVVGPTNRLRYLAAILDRVAGKPGSSLAAEEIAGQVLGEVSVPGGRSPRACFRTGQIAWYAERIGRARETMIAAPERPHTLASLADAAGMSPFHFAHVFRELEGVPPHRLLLRLRLERAAAMLKRGESVTRTSYACGFCSLSHFVRSFSRAYGVTPSRWR